MPVHRAPHCCDKLWHCVFDKHNASTAFPGRRGLCAASLCALASVVAQYLDRFDSPWPQCWWSRASHVKQTKRRPARAKWKAPMSQKVERWTRTKKDPGELHGFQHDVFFLRGLHWLVAWPDPISLSSAHMAQDHECPHHVVAHDTDMKSMTQLSAATTECPPLLRPHAEQPSATSATSLWRRRSQ